MDLGTASVELNLQALAWFGSAFWLIACIGFLAQMVNGALGMAYGVTSSALMLALGIPPQAISASVHAAEVVTTGASGISHYFAGNLDRTLVISLALPGVLGGIAGALLLTRIPGEAIKPLVSVYLLVIGVMIARKAWIGVRANLQRAAKPGLGLTAGFLDAVGGGGWGAITTGSLIHQQHEPRKAIGSANAAEFFVTTSITVVLWHAFGLMYLKLVAALMLGGVIVAPIAAQLTRFVSARVAMASVASLTIALSLWNLGRIL
jgi:uncharacterized protein